MIRSQILPNCSKLSDLLSSENSAIRFRISRFLCELSRVNLSFVLRNFYLALKQKITNIQCDFDRYGAAEFLLGLSHLECSLLGAVSLLALSALKLIGDQTESIRDAANCSFRNLVVLLPLENVYILFAIALISTFTFF